MGSVQVASSAGGTAGCPLTPLQTGTQLKLLQRRPSVARRLLSLIKASDPFTDSYVAAVTSRFNILVSCFKHHRGVKSVKRSRTSESCLKCCWCPCFCVKRWWRPSRSLRDQQSLIAAHQFLLSGEVCVMTPVSTSDKSDEALVKVVRFCWSLKPSDINLCKGRWTGKVSEGRTEERGTEEERPRFRRDRSGEWRGGRGREELMISICLRRLGEKSIVRLLE